MRPEYIRFPARLGMIVMGGKRYVSLAYVEDKPYAGVRVSSGGVRAAFRAQRHRRWLAKNPKNAILHAMGLQYINFARPSTEVFRVIVCEKQCERRSGCSWRCYRCGCRYVMPEEGARNPVFL